MYAWIFHYFLPDVISKEASKLASPPHTTTILFHHNSNEFTIIKKEDFLLKCFIEKCSIFTLITNIEGRSPFWIFEKSYFSMSIIIFIGGQTLFAIFFTLAKCNLSFLWDLTIKWIKKMGLSQAFWYERISQIFKMFLNVYTFKNPKVLAWILLMLIRLSF